MSINQPNVVVETDDNGIAKRLIIDGLVIEYFYELTVNLAPVNRTSITVTIPANVRVLKENTAAVKVGWE